MFNKLIFAFTLLVSLNLFAGSYFVQDTNVSGNNSTIGDTVKALIVQSLEAKGMTIVNNANNAIVFKPAFLQLGDSYIMTLSKTEKGKTSSQKMKVKNLNDLDVVTDRLVSSLLTDVTAEESIKVNKVTQEEKEKNIQKIKVTRQWLFGFGPAWFMNLGKTAGYNFLLGYIWGLDHYFDLNVKYEYSGAEGKSDACFTLFSFGGNYFFNDKIHAPYVAADLGYGSAEHADKTDKSGWGLGLGGGMKFFRASSVNFGVEGKYSMILKQIHDKTPSQLTLKIVLFF